MSRFLTYIDWLTVLPVLVLSIMGTITLFSFNMNNVAMVSQGLILKHIISLALGIFLAFIVSKIDYRSLSNLVQSLFFAIVGLLILVLMIGDRVNGAKSWLSVGSFNLQPAEFAKLVVILIVAHYLSRYHHKLNSFVAIMLSLLPVFFIVILVLLQPDFGTAMIIISIWLGMLVFGGIRLQHILALLGMGFIIFAIFWVWIFQDYQKQRIFTFLDPTSDPLGSGYNSLQSMRSVISGGIDGVQSQLVVVPEVHTDFIFSGFAQQWGFVGVSIYFITILIIMSRMIYIGIKAQDSFPKMIVLGVVLCIISQLIINIGMNLGIMPITGVPLPFMSYGGTSMLLYWMLIGLILSVQNHQLSEGTIFMKDNNDIFG